MSCVPVLQKQMKKANEKQKIKIENCETLKLIKMNVHKFVKSK